MKYLFLYSFLLLPIVALAQQSDWCIKGVVVDREDGLPVPAAHITALDGKIGTVSDVEGRFELCGLMEGTVGLSVGHTAFEQQVLKVDTKSTAQLIIKLRLKIYSTAEVEVKGQQNTIVKQYIPGKLSLKKDDILNLPAFLGSPDVLRGLQLLPGMQSVSEGNSGIYVRGGSPGHNYVLFDNIELMNPTHLMGMYSVFNPLLTNRVEFFKGNAPVHQSSRLASSIIVHTYQQKPDSSNWAGNIGNIITNLTYNGQSANKKWYLSTGIRRSYLDVLKYIAQPFLSEEDNYFEQNAYTFYDWNGKLRYHSGRNSLQLSWYMGQDDFQMDNAKNSLQSESKWGNQGASLVWKNSLQPHLLMENTLAYSAYFSNFGAEVPDGRMRFETDYEQISVKSTFSLSRENHLLRWGCGVTLYDVVPQNIELSNFNTAEVIVDDYRSTSAKIFISDQAQLSDHWSVYGGVALNLYRMLHAGRAENSLATDKAVQVVPNVTFSINYDPYVNSSYKASYAYNSQNIHLASIASIPLPSDVWMPATAALPMETSHQLTVGYFKSYPDKQMQWGVEAYGKYMDNQLLLKLNTNQDEVESFEDNFYKGQGIAYGSEVYINKEAQPFSYTLSYTLGWVQQQYDGINAGKWHDAKYDRRHDLNIQTVYRCNKRIDFGAVFIFATGNKATLPTGRYWMMGNIANDYAGVNNYRMPPYHRLDVSMNYRLRSRLFAESVLNFSIINLYARSNPYFIYYEVAEGQQDYELSIKAKQVSLFPIMPSLSWRFKF
ncbi:TonB-dependent receptor [Carboxylicivirga taeanensis]|uniref:TonB-dependent receptor n=1 Tax=Carboxylicivirga taeanensis TaxID=1416875 RepID=UPI003F6DDA4B